MYSFRLKSFSHELAVSKPCRCFAGLVEPLCNDYYLNVT